MSNKDNSKDLRRVDTSQKLDENQATGIYCGLQKWPPNDSRANCNNIKPTSLCKLKSLHFCFCF